MAIAVIHPWEWVMLYEQEDILVPVSYDRARERLSDAFCSEIETVRPSWFRRGVHYRGELYGSEFVFRGPYGYKRWRLYTTGRLEPRHADTHIRLKMRLCGLDQALLVTILCIFLGMAFFFLRALIIIVPFQLLFIYAVLVGVFRYEAYRVKEILVSILTTGDW
jgi:hypothetical protein